MEEFSLKTLVKFNHKEQEQLMQKSLEIYRAVGAPELPSMFRRIVIGSFLILIAVIFIIVGIMDNQFIITLPSVILLAIGVSVISWAVLSRTLRIRRFNYVLKFIQKAFDKTKMMLADDSVIDLRIRELIQLRTLDNQLYKRYRLDDLRAIAYKESITLLFHDDFMFSISESNSSKEIFNSLLNHLKLNSTQCLFAEKNSDGSYYL